MQRSTPSVPCFPSLGAAFALTLTFAAATASAAPPVPVYSGQLRLLDDTAPVVDGPYDMIFAVYEAADASLSAGTLVFLQTFDDVNVQGGNFQLLLDANETGAGLGLGALSALVADDAHLFMQLTVNAEPLEPQLLGAVPWAERTPVTGSVLIHFSDLRPIPATEAQYWSEEYWGWRRLEVDINGEHPLRAPVRLPQGAVPTQLSCVTRSQNSTASNCRARAQLLKTDFSTLTAGAAAYTQCAVVMASVSGSVNANGPVYMARSETDSGWTCTEPAGYTASDKDAWAEAVVYELGNETNANCWGHSAHFNYCAVHYRIP